MIDTIQLNVNGKTVRVTASQDASLLNVLRNELDLTGSKYGCGEGQCGACTVLIDGVATRSCITKAQTVAGRKITTIEGLESNGRLHPLQEAFLQATALQCGYCTPGMIMSGVALLAKNTNPTDAEIVRAMQGNVCRCGVYKQIVAAIKDAAKAMKEGGK
ncbi:MAG TPA: (2Fe-2S)-binding protein [Blastocatellia bacterium]|nr:(2Fe-2S)-binding protein [Blastocatellia bacterium]